MKKSDLLLPLTTFAMALFMAGFLIAGFTILAINADLPNAQNIKGVELKVPLRVYSADHILISEFGNERRKPIAIEEIPKTLINAVLASEDDRFFSHNGIDFFGLFRAAISNYRSGETQQGASTITMQVARNFFLSREKTYVRKVREILLAIKLEQILSKNEILSLYLNKIFLGHRAYGFGAAAEVYYNKPLNELSLAETAMLAGLPKAPSSNNPLRNPVRAVSRRNYVLKRMVELEKIDENIYQNTIKEPITAAKHKRGVDLNAPHIAEMVRAQLLEQFGEDAYWQGLNVYTTIQSKQQQAASQVLRKGLKSYDKRHGFRGPITRIELDKQEDKLSANDEQTAAEAYETILEEFPDSQEQRPALVINASEDNAEIYIKGFGQQNLPRQQIAWAKKYLTENLIGNAPKQVNKVLNPGDIIYVEPDNDTKQTDSEQTTQQWLLSQIPNIGGALISIEPNSGKIISLVGGYDFFLNKYNRAVQSIRQPGSNIKPFIYAAALSKGFTPASLISGAPIVMTDPVHGTVWRPENYSGEFFGPTRMRTALGKSLNLVSIRLLRSIGVPYAREYISRFGIDITRFSPTLTMALGSGGVTPLEMLAAYSTLANTGYKVEPYFIDYITDRDGNVVYKAKQPTFCDECYFDYLAIDETLAEDSLSAESSIPAEDSDPDTDNEGNQHDDSEISNIDEVEELDYQAPRVMSREDNFMIVSMMKDVVKRGTARKALVLEREDLAGKTGTTNDYVDAWFTGFNSKIATTVWVGFDDPTSMGRGEAGSVAALPIWINYMRTALEGLEEDTQNLPEYIEEGFVNRSTGERTDELDPEAVSEYFVIESLLPQKPPISMDQQQLDIDQMSPLDILEGDNQLTDDSQPLENSERIIESTGDTEGLF